MRRPLAIGVLAVVAFALHVSAAAAAPGVRYGIQDDAWLASGPGTLDARLDRLQSLGVAIVRYTVHWNQCAPRQPARALQANDPAYRWSLVDPVLQGLHERGIQAVVTLVGSPRWANGGGRPNVAPRSTSTFAGFAYAVAKR